MIRTISSLHDELVDAASVEEAGRRVVLDADLAFDERIRRSWANSPTDEHAPRTDDSVHADRTHRIVDP